MPILSKEKRKIYSRRIQGFWEDFRHNRIGFVGLLIILGYVFLAIFAPWLTPFPPINTPRVAAAYAIPQWLTAFPQYQNLSPTTWIPLNWTTTQDYESINMKYGDIVTLNYHNVREAGDFQTYTCQVQFNFTYEIPNSFEVALNWEATFNNVDYRLEVNITTPDGTEYALLGKDYSDATKHIIVKEEVWNRNSSTWLSTSGSQSLRRRMMYEELYKQSYQKYYDFYLQAIGLETYYNSTYNAQYHVQEFLYKKEHGTNESFSTFWNDYWYGPDGYWNTTGIPKWENEKVKYEAAAQKYAESVAPLEADTESRNFSAADMIFPKEGTYKITLYLIVKPLSEEDATLKIIFSENDRFRIWGSIFGILGTDSYGKDTFTALIYGTQISLLIGILAAAISTGLGIFFGVAAGYLGGIVDEVTMRIVDVLLCLPVLPILLALSAYYNPNVYFIVIIIAIFGWQGLSRVIRSRVLSLREMPFIESARASGASDSYLIFRHLIPNVFPIAMASLILAVPAAILTEASMSFLGFGDPLAPTWGKMLHEAFERGAFKQFALWYILPPGFAITSICVAFVFLGHALDEIVNPRLRRRR